MTRCACSRTSKGAWGLEQTEGGSKAVVGAPPAHGYQGCRQDTEGARHAGWWRLNPPGKKEGG